jgi:hypothetical protein
MLYKYFPPERVDVLEKLKIRFSPLQSLNDPFEQTPLINIDKVREDFIFETVREFDACWFNSDPAERTKENRKLLDKIKIESIRASEEILNPYAVGQGVVSLLGDNFGVLSLSRAENSLLMWSHYADEGKGIVLGFDDDHTFFHQRDMKGHISRPIPVVYSVKRKLIVPGEEKYYEKLLCEKPLEWVYEEEERLFRTFSHKSGSESKDSYGQDVVLSELPKETILSIYLGYNVSKQTEIRVFQALKSNQIKCKIYRARLCRHEYKIVFDSL